MPAIRVYADTSVFGGVFDEEFKNASRAFFEQVRDGRFQLVTSAAVRAELESAPTPVRELFKTMAAETEVADIGDAALRLQQAYLEAGVVTAKHAGDALHVAVASVSRCAIMVSWNFKHIVHFQRIGLYNGVNTGKGYGPLAIHSPLEVIADEGEDEDV